MGSHTSIQQVFLASFRIVLYVFGASGCPHTSSLRDGFFRNLFQSQRPTGTNIVNQNQEMFSNHFFSNSTHSLSVSGQGTSTSIFRLKVFTFRVASLPSESRASTDRLVVGAHGEAGTSSRFCPPEPNDPSLATRHTGRNDGNRDVPVGFAQRMG